MKRYEIEYTSKAYDDLFSIQLYISSEYQNPRSARKIVTLIEDKIHSLCTFPEGYRTLEFLPTIKVVSIRGYRIFFKVDSSHRKVSILRIIHSKRDIDSNDIML